MQVCHGPYQAACLFVCMSGSLPASLCIVLLKYQVLQTKLGRQSWADMQRLCCPLPPAMYHVKFSSVSLVTHSNKVALYNLSNMATLTCNVLKAPVYNLTGMQTTSGSVKREQLSMECSSSGRHTETIDCMVGQAPLMGIVVDLALTPAKMRL